MPRKPKTDAPWELSEIERRRIGQHAKKKHPGLVAKLQDEWEKCRDWHLSNGVQRSEKGWEATFRNWLKKAEEFEVQRSGLRRVEMPQENRKAGPNRFVSVGKVLDDFLGEK